MILLKRCRRWSLSRRFQNYTIRNHKLSPMNRLEFQFMKRLYWYFTKQYNSTTPEFREYLYNDYIQLVNLTYKFNRVDQSPLMQDIIIEQLEIILEAEASGPRSFILLNFDDHVQKMRKAIKLFSVWFRNPDYYGYASEKEFFEAMDFLRKEFNRENIDIHDAVGKWPKKFRQRRIGGR